MGTKPKQFVQDKNDFCDYIKIQSDEGFKLETPLIYLVVDYLF